jgi:hypothetical protein
MNRTCTALIMCAALVLFAHVLPAQSTWGGLRFGMSRAEVDQALGSKGLKMSAAGQNPDLFDVTPAYQVSVPDLVDPIPFNVQLYFSVGKLNQITLGLDKATYIKEGGSVYAVVDVVNGSMKKALTAKYGAPFETTRPCSAEGHDLVELLLHNDMVECKSSWHGQAQLISVKWWFNKRMEFFSYFVSYQPAPSDL